MSDIQLTQEQFDELLSKSAINAIEKFKTETGMDKVDWKHLMHPHEDEKSLEKKNGVERFMSLLKAVAKQDYGFFKAADPMVEGTDASGGYLVPAITRAEILRLIPTFGQARSVFRTIPMGKTDTLNIPKKTGGSTASVVSEGSAITAHKPTLGLVTLAAKKLGDIVVVSNELLEDANVAIYNYLLEIMAEALGQKEDSEFFAGDGTNFTGLFNGSHTFGVEGTVSSYTAIDRDDLLGCVYGIDQRYLQGASWLMNRLVFSEILGLADSNGRPLVNDAFAGEPATLLGFPVKKIEAAPYTGSSGQPIVLFGNFSNSYIGDKGMMSVAYSTDGVVSSTSLFETDSSAIRVTERVAFNAGLTTAYAAISIA